MIINVRYLTDNPSNHFVPRSIFDRVGDEKIFLSIKYSNNKVEFNEVLTYWDKLGLDGQYIKLDVSGDIREHDFIEFKGYEFFVCETFDI